MSEKVRVYEYHTENEKGWYDGTIKVVAKKDYDNLAEINKVLVEELEKIGHRSEPDHLDASQSFGYMYCCEDVIKDANAAIAKAKEMMK